MLSEHTAHTNDLRSYRRVIRIILLCIMWSEAQLLQSCRICLIRHTLCRLELLHRQALLLRLCQHMHLLSHIQAVRPASTTKTGRTRTARSARKHIPTHMLLAIPFTMLWPAFLHLRWLVVLTKLVPSHTFRLLLELQTHVAMSLARPHCCSEAL